MIRMRAANHQKNRLIHLLKHSARLKYRDNREKRKTDDRRSETFHVRYRCIMLHAHYIPRRG